MNNYCAFNKNYKCLKWMDYKLEKTDALCHGD